MVARSIINMNVFPGAHEYALIDHARGGLGLQPWGSSYATGATWNSNLDANGWPNHSSYDSRTFCIPTRVPDSDDFAGPYVLTWEGSGEVGMDEGSWTIDSGASSNYTAVTASRWHGSNSRIVVSYSGAERRFNLMFYRTNRDGSGNFLKNVKFYRLEDEADLQSGKVFRTGWLQTLVDLNPAAVRVMNWTGGNNTYDSRWRYRTQPTLGALGGLMCNFVASPPYGETTGTNLYSLASATGMPVAMEHGEMVTCRLGNSTVRGLRKIISSITQEPNGVVTTAVDHGYNTGDKIIHRIVGPTGMVELDQLPATITVLSSTTYELNIDTSGFTAFNTTETPVASQYISLNVGGRGAYPVVFHYGTQTASHFGDSYMAAGDYKTFYFDKYLVCDTTIGPGAWIFNNWGAANGGANPIPGEIITTFGNELKALADETSAATGKTYGPTDIWISIPHRGLISCDPDYDADDHWGVNMVDTILNGANGYDGLDPSIKLIVEYSNETWNFAGGDFTQPSYLARVGHLRWPASGATDSASWSTLRSIILVNDIKDAFPNHPQLKYVICGHGTVGVSAQNSVRIYGNTYIDNDVLNTWGGDPIDHFDGFYWGAYFVASDSFDTTNLTNLTNDWLAADGDDEAQEAICAEYVVGVIGTGSGETTSRYGDTLLPEYAAALLAKGKKTGGYEGGWDRSVSNGTANQNLFLKAVKKSHAWASALRDFFDKFDLYENAEYPPDYLQVEERWGHAYPTQYLNGVEGAGLDRAWVYAALRNRGIKRMRITTS